MGQVTVFVARAKNGETCCFGVESTAKAWARSGTVERVELRGADLRTVSCADGSMPVEEVVEGVIDLFPGADRQSLRCLAELLMKPPKLAGQEVWIVLDENMEPVYCAGWREACHEHINEAISEHDIPGAGSWRVVKAVVV